MGSGEREHGLRWPTELQKQRNQRNRKNSGNTDFAHSRELSERPEFHQAPCEPPKGNGKGSALKLLNKLASGPASLSTVCAPGPEARGSWEKPQSNGTLLKKNIACMYIPRETRAPKGFFFSKNEESKLSLGETKGLSRVKATTNRWRRRRLSWRRAVSIRVRCLNSS